MSRSSPLVLSSVIPPLAHASLFTFTLLVEMKIQGTFSNSWWWVFFPLWIFHLVISRCKVSIPAPNTPNDRLWSPCHSILFFPLLISFEILLCCYLVSLEDGGVFFPVKIGFVFVPIILLEAIILIDNFRMCIILMPSEDDNVSDEVLFETLPFFIVTVSMIFLIAATMFSILKLSGEMESLDWWDLFVNFCIGECFSFLLCVKWSNPLNPSLSPRNSQSPLLNSPSLASPLLPSPNPNPQSSSTQLPHHPTPPSPIPHSESSSIPEPPFPTPSLNPNPESSSTLQPTPEPTPEPHAEISAENSTRNSHVGQRIGSGSRSSSDLGSPRFSEASVDPYQTYDSDPRFGESCCSLRDFGGHCIKIGLLVFQILVCMKLEGEPIWIMQIPIWMIFSPLLFVQFFAFFISLVQFLHNLVFALTRSPLSFLPNFAHETDPCEFLTHGTRLIGCWSVDDELREEKKNRLRSLMHDDDNIDVALPSYLSQMRKNQLAQEVYRLHAQLVAQSESTKSQRFELERIQTEKVLCQICFDREICIVLLPCRHRVLCKGCADKCVKCPICRKSIFERMMVYDV